MAQGSIPETIYTSINAGASLNTFTSEALLNTVATMGPQPYLPKGFWTPSPTSQGRGINIKARGIYSCTGTPTFQPIVRLGGAAAITGPVILGAAAGITCPSGVTNQLWTLDGDFWLTGMGTTAASATGRGEGFALLTGTTSAGGSGGLFGGNSAGATPGTLTNLDITIDNYVNLSVVCSASSASNVFALHQLKVEVLN